MAYTAIPLIISGDPITAAWGNTYLRDNITYLKGAAGAVAITDALTLSGGLTAGSGSVGIIDSTGKIPAISSTYFASLSGANLTSLPSSQLTGALPAISGAALTALNAAVLSGALPAISGAALTALTAANITAGGTLPALVGSALTSLNATNINSGSLGMNLLSAGDWIYQTTLTAWANNATQQIGSTTSVSGVLLVAEQNGAYGPAIFGLGGTGPSASLLAGSSTRYSSLLATATHINMGTSAGSYYLENKTGGAINVRMILIGYAS